MCSQRGLSGLQTASRVNSEANVRQSTEVVVTDIQLMQKDVRGAESSSRVGRSRIVPIRTSNTIHLRPNASRTHQGLHAYN